MSLPDSIIDELKDPVYRRSNAQLVGAALERLGVTPSPEFCEFYQAYEGPFWSETLGIEVVDLIANEDSIEALTQLCRSRYNFPPQVLVLTQLCAGGTVHVLDTRSDQVLVVDFEGGHRLLAEGTLEADWPSFAVFLAVYFGDP